MENDIKNIINMENITDIIDVSTDYSKGSGFNAPILAMDLPNVKYVFDLNYESHLKGLFLLFFIKDETEARTLKFKFLLFKQFIERAVYCQEEINKHDLFYIIDYINSYEINYGLFEEYNYSSISDFDEIFSIYSYLSKDITNKDWIDEISKVDRKPLLLFKDRIKEREFLDFNNFIDTGLIQILSLIVSPETRLRLLTRSLLDDKYKVIENKTIIPLCNNVYAIYRTGGYQLKVNYEDNELDFFYKIDFREKEYDNDVIYETVEFTSKDNRELKLKLTKQSKEKHNDQSIYTLEIGDAEIEYNAEQMYVYVSGVGGVFNTGYGRESNLHMTYDTDGSMCFINEDFLIYYLLLCKKNLKSDKYINEFIMKTHSNDYLKLLRLGAELERLVVNLGVRFVVDEPLGRKSHFITSIVGSSASRNYSQYRTQYRSLFNDGAFNLSDILTIVQVFDELTDTDKLRSDVNSFIDNREKEKDLEKRKLQNRKRESLKSDIDLFWSKQ